ncbi:MAG: glycosyltransferase, partial [Bdellovibrionales bacterium]|nr:glycosyltransferase [Bdellovibrionales bacterium]
LYHQLHRAVARHIADRVVVVSSALGEELVFSGMEKLRVIRNVVSFDVPVGGEAVGSAVTVVGRLVPVKQVDHAISGFAEYVRRQNGATELCLEIIGDGPELAGLQTLVASLGLEERISFLGFRSDAFERIRRSRALLMTSAREGIPTVLLEAIACGRPVVVPRVGGIPEVLEMLPGYPAMWLDAMSPEAVADGLASAMSCPPASAELRDRAMQLFSPQRAAGEHQTLYAELL